MVLRNKAFLVVAPTFWNSVRLDLHIAPSLDTFHQGQNSFPFQTILLMLFFYRFSSTGFYYCNAFYMLSFYLLALLSFQLGVAATDCLYFELLKFTSKKEYILCRFKYS